MRDAIEADIQEGLPAGNPSGQPSTIPDVSFLGPDRVLDAAYALHVVATATPEEQGQEIYRMARQIVEDFHRLCAGVLYGSPEWAFLFSLQQIMVSLAKGIGRRKRELEERVRVAKEKRERRLRELTSNTIKAGFLKAGWRVILWGGLGYVMTHTLLPKDSMAEHASPTYPSLAVAIACVLIGSFIRARVTNSQYTRIYDACESAQLQAQTAYNKGALEEYRRAKRDAARAWERFTNKKPTEWLAFDAVLAEDLAHVQDLCDEQEDSRQNPLLRWASPVGHWVNKYLLFLRKRQELRVAARSHSAHPKKSSLPRENEE